MASGARTVIDVWLNDYPFPGFRDPMEEAARTFNEAHPEYELRIHFHDFRAMPAQVARGVAEGNPPHVAEYFYSGARLATDTLGPGGEPLFTSVGRAVGGRKEILGEPVLLDDLVPAARDHFVVGGEQMSVPPTASTVILFANTTLLRQAGVAEVPRTWMEFEAACRALAMLDGGPAHRVVWPNHGWIFLQALAQQGELVCDQDNGRTGRAERVWLASDAMIAFATWWQRLYRDGHFYYSGTRSDWNGCFQAFGEQRVAFILSSSVDAGRLVEMGRTGGFTVQAARMPYNDEVPFAGNMIGGDSLWLAAGLDEVRRDGALAFMQHVLKPGHAAQWHKVNGRIPITRASFNLLDEEGWFNRNPHLRVATEQLEAADGSPAALGPVIGDFAGVQEQITRAMHDVLVDGVAPQTRFAAASQRAQRLLDAYNAHCVGPPRRSPASFKVGW
jgi:sn-glycerol 3-phosphate transport system substrate-binding protein